MSNQRLRIQFKNVTEIRMGSPFHVATIEMDRNIPTPLAGKEFQDVSLVSSDGQCAILIEWDIVQNSPGFRIIRLLRNKDTTSFSTTRTPRIEGAVVTLAWNSGEGSLNVQVFRSGNTESIQIPTSHFS